MVLAVVADLIHANRRETQRSMHRIRAIEIALGVQPEHYQSGAVQSPDGSNR
jgi:exosome complex RNA-binding protein Rrp42 (RNase PH superfamily)